MHYLPGPSQGQEGQGKKASIYLYVRKTHLVMANRGAKPLEEAGRGMEGRFDGSYMAWPAYTGDAPRGTAKVWDDLMGEVIRIFHRSREENVVLLNSKTGDFASYSLPLN